MRRRQQPVHVRDLDWYKFIRRYFWDDETTPYLVPVARMHRRQADHEIFAYCVFLILVFCVVTLVSMTGKAPYGRSLLASLLGLTVCCSALLLGTTKHVWAATACALGPLGALVFFLSFHLQPALGLLDRSLLIVFSALWVRYSLRVINLAWSYPHLPDPPSSAAG